MSEIKIADEFFEAHQKSMILEDRLVDALLVAMDIDPDEVDTWPCDDFTFDFYDSSFELKNTKLGGWIPSASANDKFKEFGFFRYWVCYVDGTETYVRLI